MDSVFARTTLLGLSLFASLASAKPFHAEHSITAEFSAHQSERYSHASALLNYADGTLDLGLQALCPEGETCEEAPEIHTYNFESVKSTVNRCGVITSTVVVDKTPVDGVRFEVTLQDHSSSTCRGPKPAAATLDVNRKWYNRLQGGWVTSRDRFTADDVSLVEPAVPFQGVIRALLEPVTSEAFVGGHLAFDGRYGRIELSLDPVMPPCPEGMMCIQRMPPPETYKLENAKSHIDECGVIRITGRGQKDATALDVQININSNNTCPTFAPLAALDVMVTVTRDGVTTSDLLKADDYAMIKPGK
jgi:hypothetical protein